MNTFTQTNVSGFISSNTAWTLSGSPYIITGNTVLDSGFILTIDPGVMVKFNSAKSLQINGILRAVGNSSNKITFTSNLASPAPGDWDYILFADQSTDYNYTLLTGSIMEYCIVEYAGGNSLYQGGAIRMSASFPYIRNCEVRNNSTTGILFFNEINVGTLKISKCNVHDNNANTCLNCKAGGIDFSVLGAQAIVDSCIIINNKGCGGGIKTGTNNSTCKITNNLIIGNSAQYGGGIQANGGVVDCSYNLVFGNSASTAGAGIWENAVGGYSRTINNNIIVNNTSTNNIVFVYPYCNMTKNTIIDNTASSNIITVFGGNTSTTGNNTITRNKVGGTSSKGVVYIMSPTIFKTNNIYRDNANFEVYTDVLQSTPSINAKNCWWNTTTSTNIDTMIYDFLDNSLLTIVNYSPFATSPDTIAPVTPPINVIKTDLGGGKIKITWNANMETDLAGYKIYWGSPTGYSFAHSLNAGNVTTDTLTLILITDTIAVTAYDTQSDGVKDQFEGHESWYTYAVGKPSPVFSATPDPVCPGEIVYFTANIPELYSYTNTTWKWSFPGGMPSVSSIQNPKVIYSTNGIHDVKLNVTNIAGKDSLTLTNYIVVKSRSYATISPNVCKVAYYTSPSGKNTWYSSGTYQDTIPNHAGCDSVLTINLKLGHETYATISPVGCNSYISPSGNHIWTSSDTYFDTLQNYLGCDSIIIINLTVYKMDTSITVNGNMLTSNSITPFVNYRWLNCTNGFSAIPGENHQSYTPVTNGNYAVAITQGICKDTSSCYQVTVVGINTLNLKNEATLYPNPASDNVIINIDRSKNMDLTLNIYNVMGILVSSEILKQNNRKINIRDLSNGIYMVTIKSKEWSENKKLIIKK